MSKAEEKLEAYIVAVRQLKASKAKLKAELKESMKIIKAHSKCGTGTHTAAGTTINQDCMTGACAGHRRELAETNIAYYGAIQWYRQGLYISWIAFGITISLLIFFRYLIVDLIV